MAGGLAPATPVAAIHSATTGDEEVARGVLAALGALPVAAPATIVIGAVAALRHDGAPVGAPTPVATTVSSAVASGRRVGAPARRR